MIAVNQIGFSNAEPDVLFATGELALSTGRFI